MHLLSFLRKQEHEDSSGDALSHWECVYQMKKGITVAGVTCFDVERQTTLMTCLQAAALRETIRDNQMNCLDSPCSITAGIFINDGRLVWQNDADYGNKLFLIGRC